MKATRPEVTRSDWSVRVSMADPVAQRHPQDLDVERQGPVLDVVEVVLDPLRKARVAAPAMDLRPPRDPRADAMADHVLRELLLELPDELRPLGPRADEGHLAAQHVTQLRQLVEAPPPQEASDAG